MTEVALMIPPTANDDAGLRILLQGRGLWRDTPVVGAGGGVDINQVRARMATLVKDVAASKDDFKDLRGSLRIKGVAFLGQILDKQVQEVLRDVADAADPDDPPLLSIHLSAGNDWIPWELLHDGTDLLGLRFRITRVPIVATAPDMPIDVNHKLERVTSVLGQDVVKTGNGEFDAWAKTFEGLLPDGVTADLRPPDAGAEPTDNTPIFEETDILHVTCHGASDDDGSAWTLFPGVTLNDRWRYTVVARDLVGVKSSLESRRPLVFGNACTSAGGAQDTAGTLDPGLAMAFFEGGAQNVIGTFAPIRKVMALPFARRFYETLLHDGETISRALWKTKRSFVENPPPDAHDATFLFYCLYGSPDTVFQGAQPAPLPAGP